MAAAVERAGVPVPIRHLANSAATLTDPAAHFDLVRPGIAVYGLSPVPDLGDPAAYRLTPAMTLRGRLSLVKRVPAGEGVSYGHEYHTDRDTTLALVPLGYADGVPRSAGNRGETLVAGRRRRVAGRVCMDQYVVDLGAGPDADAARAGDPAVLFGPGTRRRADRAGLGRGGRHHLLRDRHAGRRAGAAALRRRPGVSATRTMARVGIGLAAAGVGAALGLAAERVAAGRTLADEDAGVAGLTPYGALRGRPRTVTTADGTKLHVEVDDLDLNRSGATKSAGASDPSAPAPRRTRARDRRSSSPTGSRSTWTPGTSSGRPCAGTTDSCCGTSAGTADRPAAHAAARPSRRSAATWPGCSRSSRRTVRSCWSATRWAA